jgi:hypothetical protein
MICRYEGNQKNNIPHGQIPITCPFLATLPLPPRTRNLTIPCLTRAMAENRQ